MILTEMWSFSLQAVVLVIGEYSVFEWTVGFSFGIIICYYWNKILHVLVWADMNNET